MTSLAPVTPFKRTTLMGHIGAFFVMLVFTLLLTFMFSIPLIIFWAITIIIMFYFGYGISAIMGCVIGGLIWFIDIWDDLITAITNPFSGWRW